MSRFNRLAKEWDLKPARVQSARKVSDTLRALIDITGMRVVDYGAGTGLVAFDLADDAQDVIAMDNASGMLAEIERKCHSAGVENIQTQYHDIQKEDLPAGQFDLFVSAMTLHHIPNTEDFLTKAKRSLRKGGYVAISDLEREDGTFHSGGDAGVAHFGFDTQALKTLFDAVGLEVVFCERVEVIKKAKEYPIFLIVGKNV